MRENLEKNIRFGIIICDGSYFHLAPSILYCGGIFLQKRGDIMSFLGSAPSGKRSADHHAGGCGRKAGRG